MNGRLSLAGFGPDGHHEGCGAGDTGIVTLPPHLVQLRVTSSHQRR